MMDTKGSMALQGMATPVAATPPDVFAFLNEAVTGHMRDGLD